MTVTIERSMNAKQRQKVLSDLYNSMQEKRRVQKLNALKKVRGNVIFDKTGKKSALDIQKEMRDEWN